jgi:glycosyl transferase family 2
VITIVTITARRDPMWEPMLQSLAEARQVARGGDESFYLEWVVVDAGLWYDPRRVIDLHHLVMDSGGPFPVIHIAPKPSVFHGPWTDRHLPDQNGARNTGIVYANGDYLVFIDDCSVVHPNFLRRAWAAREESRIVRFAHRFWRPIVNHGLKPPDDERYAQYGRLTETSLRGSGVGYPLAILLDMNGFDERFSGAPKEDIGIGIRLKAAGHELWEDNSTLIVESLDEAPLFKDVLPTPNEGRLSRWLGLPIHLRPVRADGPDLRAARSRITKWRLNQ